MQPSLITTALCVCTLFVATGHPVAAETIVCFTPGGNCTNQIQAAIDAAKQSILVQAFNFTSRPILRALAEARRRGVRIEVILSQKHERPSYAARYLMAQGIQPLVDDKVKTAHNKIIIIDTSIVITGSFNFTTAAQEQNAENVLIISDFTIASQYVTNFKRRASVSRLFNAQTGQEQNDEAE